MAKKRAIRKVRNKPKRSIKHLKHKVKSKYNHNKGKRGGIIVAVVRAILYRFESPNVTENSYYAIWQIGMTFRFESGKPLEEKKQYILNDLDNETPELYKLNMIRQITVYRNFRYISHLDYAFDRAKTLLDKITRDKKVYEKLSGISEDEALKEWRKYVIYRIKRGNKVRVLEEY
jgi:hypothetical protein